MPGRVLLPIRAGSRIQGLDSPTRDPMPGPSCCLTNPCPISKTCSGDAEALITPALRPKVGIPKHLKSRGKKWSCQDVRQPGGGQGRMQRQPNRLLQKSPNATGAQTRFAMRIQTNHLFVTSPQFSMFKLHIHNVLISSSPVMSCEPPPAPQSGPTAPAPTQPQTWHNKLSRIPPTAVSHPPTHQSCELPDVPIPHARVLPV